MTRLMAFLKQSFRRHWIALALAILVSIVYGSHHFFIVRALGGNKDIYRPLTFASHADASVYGIRANAVYQGQWLAGDISMPEQSGNPATLPLLNPLIMGGLGRLLGSLDRALILSDFLFPPLIFVALYFLAFELTRRRTLAVFFAAFFIFVPKAILPFPPVTPSLLRTLIERVMPDPSGILYFARFEYPKITFLFSAPALYGVLRAIRREEQWSTWLAGISFGLMFYTYLYDWVYFFIALSLTAVMLAYLKKWSVCVRLAKIAGIGFAVSMPYWYNFLLIHQLPHYGDIASRIGMETGRAVRWASVKTSYLRITALAALLPYLASKRERPVIAYLAGLLLAYIVAVNIQIVTGFNLHPDHWYRISFLPIALALLAAGYWAAQRLIAPRVLAYGAAAAIVSTGFLFGRSLISQYQYGNANARYYVVDQPYAGAYEWLAQYAPKRALIASIAYDTNNELALYTPQRTFLLNGLHTTAPDKKIWQRFMETGAAFNVSPKTFSALMRDKNLLFYLFLNEYGDNTFDATFRNDANSQRRLPSDVAARMAAAYERVRTEEKPEAVAARTDYLLIGPREDLIGSVKPVKNLENVYDADGVRIYKTIQ